MSVQNTVLISVLFDYPDDWEPRFYKNSLKYFDNKDIHILRYHKLIQSDSYYKKLYYYKVIALFDYISKNIINKYENILFLDATDTNFYSDPSRLITDFQQMNKSIIFCAERGLWPPTNYTHLYENRPKLTPSCYLNSGMYFGKSNKISEHLDNIIKNEYSIDDQGAWTAEYLLSHDIDIDQENKYFFSTYNSKELIKTTNPTVEFNGINPILIHDNGPYNDDTIKLTEILNQS